jgi:hypothetical protein
MSRATETKLDQMHSLVASSIMDELDRAIARAEAHPDDPDYAVSPQLIAQAARFLAANGVSAPATAPKMENLAGKLGELDIDMEALSLPAKH